MTDLKNENSQEKGSESIKLTEKLLLTVDEASALSGIGQNSIRRMMRKKNCPFVFSVGRKKLIKRTKFEKYLEERSHI